jgi:hypothetical protein
MKITLVDFENWYDALSLADQVNIGLLLTMPNMDTLIEKMEGGKLKDMVVFGQSVMRVANKLLGEGR